MYLNIIAQVIFRSTRGTLTFNKVSSIEIRSSWKELTSTATLTLPRNLVLKNKKVEEYITRGDEVEIKIGYNGEIYNEFKGYVISVEPNEPLTIECEDEMFRLKQKSFTKSWSKVTLKELLEFVAGGYPMSCLDTTLQNYMIEGATAVQVFDNLQQDLGIYTYFRDGVLHCGFPYSSTFSKVKYNLQGNVKKNDLKYKTADATKIKVRVSAKQPNGIEIKVEAGDPEGELRELKLGSYLPEKEMKAHADSILKLYKYDGYKGSLTGFGWPRVNHGDQADLIDPRYPERAGSFLVDKVVTRVGSVFFERIVDLGPKV